MEEELEGVIRVSGGGGDGGVVARVVAVDSAVMMMNTSDGYDSEEKSSLNQGYHFYSVEVMESLGVMMN